MTRQTFIQKHEERITRFWSKLVSHRDIDHAQSCISEKTWVHFFVYSYFHWLLFDFLLFWKTCIHMQMQSIKRFNINDSTLTLSFSWTLIFIANKTFYYLVSWNIFFLANCNFNSYMMSSCTAIVLLLLFIFQFNLFSISF